jgi:hypothetical protein
MKYIVTDDKKIIKIRLSLGTSELVNNYPEYWTMMINNKYEIFKKI